VVVRPHRMVTAQRSPLGPESGRSKGQAGPGPHARTGEGELKKKMEEGFFRGFSRMRIDWR
jgi:hypothetical protein